jgi:hypothetical protein
MLVLLLREAGRMAICQPCSAHEKRTLIENTDLSDEELRNRQEKAPSLRRRGLGEVSHASRLILRKRLRLSSML